MSRSSRSVCGRSRSGVVGFVAMLVMNLLLVRGFTVGH